MGLGRVQVGFWPECGLCCADRGATACKLFVVFAAVHLLVRGGGRRGSGVVATCCSGGGGNDCACVAHAYARACASGYRVLGAAGYRLAMPMMPFIVLFK